MTAGSKAFALFLILALATLGTWLVVGRPAHRECINARLGTGTSNQAEVQRIYREMPAADRLRLASCDGANP